MIRMRLYSYISSLESHHLLFVYANGDLQSAIEDNHPKLSILCEESKPRHIARKTQAADLWDSEAHELTKKI